MNEMRQWYVMPQEGWLCPVCHRPNAPWVVTCPCWSAAEPKITVWPTQPNTSTPNTGDPIGIPYYTTCGQSHGDEPV